MAMAFTRHLISNRNFRMWNREHCFSIALKQPWNSWWPVACMRIYPHRQIGPFTRSSRVALANYVSARYSLHREMLGKMYRRQANQQRPDKRNVRSVPPYRDISSLYTARAFAYILVDAASILDIAYNIVVSPRSSWKPLGTCTQ